MSNTFWNEENETFIKCPNCGAKYEPSYKDTTIGGSRVNCYTEDIEEYVCDDCGKKFKMRGYRSEWRYITETIDGEMTKEEHEKGSVKANEC